MEHDQLFAGQPQHRRLAYDDIQHPLQLHFHERQVRSETTITFQAKRTFHSTKTKQLRGQLFCRTVLVLSHTCLC